MLSKRLNSFKFAFRGLFDLFRTQPNARIHLLIVLLVVGAGIYFQLPRQEWLILLLAISLVLAAEAFNTAFEYLTDLVSPEYHLLAGKTKDAAAAGVLIAAIGAALIGCLVFLPRILELFQR